MRGRSPRGQVKHSLKPGGRGWGATPGVRALPPILAKALASLRAGTLLTPERLKLIPAAFLVGFAAAILALALSARGASDFKGRPLGTDFSNIYAAGRYVQEGAPTAPFDPALQERQERKIFGPATPFYGWHYPPFFLLIAAPLAALSYLPALFVWQAVSFALYLMAMALLLRSAQGLRMRDWLLAVIAFPAVFVNVTHGHNGLLTAALMAAALALLDRRRLLAGICFGLLVYKPQFGLMIPLVLAATGRWRTFVAACATVIALTALVTLLFGPEVWAAFLASTRFTRTAVLEQGGTGFYKIQSMFAWVRLWGGSVALAYAAQGAVTLIAGVFLVRLWRSDARFALKGAALCLAAILATPYSLDYDMMVLAPAIALLAMDGLEHGFPPWWKTALTALWLVPILTRSFADATFVPLGVPAMLAMFALIVAAAPREALALRTVRMRAGPSEG